MKKVLRLAAFAASLLGLTAGAQIMSTIVSSTAPITIPGFYLSNAGNDSNTGLTALVPVKTFAKAQALMQASGTIKRTYVMSAGGSFASPAVSLTSSDNGEMFVNNPGDFPALDGGSSTVNLMTISNATGITIQGLTFQNSGAGRAALILSAGTGLNVIANHFLNNGMGLLIQGTVNSTVSGNQFDNAGIGDTTGGTTCTNPAGGTNCAGSAIEMQNTSNNNTIAFNLINGANGTTTHGGCIYAHGVNSNTISHNFCENAFGMGIGILDFSVSTEDNNNNITYNIVHNSNSNATSGSDSGAIYTLGRNLYAQHTLIDHNFVDFPSTISATNIRAYYLDDCSSSNTVSNNIGVNAPNSATHNHVGSNNTFQNNAFTLSTSAFSADLSQSTSGTCAGSPPAMGGNVYNWNLITTTDATPNYLSSISGQGTTTNEFIYSAGHTWSGTSASGFTVTNLQNNVNPLFNAPGGVTISSNVVTLGDFSLQGGSTAPGLGFTTIDESQMGIVNPNTPTWAFVY